MSCLRGIFAQIQYFSKINTISECEGMATAVFGIMIKESNYLEDMTIFNVLGPNNKTSKFAKNKRNIQIHNYS